MKQSYLYIFFVFVSCFCDVACAMNKNSEKDEKGRNRLHTMASQVYYFEKMSVTIKPEEVNEPDKKNRTPLHYAASKDNLEFAKILLKAGANKLLIDDKVDTPYDKAFKKGNEKLYELLKIDSTSQENPESF